MSTTCMLKCFLSGKNAISKIGESPQQPDGTIKGEETDERVTKVPRTAMDVVGIAGFATSMATMVLTEGIVVSTACLSTMLLAPYAAYQKRILVKLGGLRGQQNQLRTSVNELFHQNRILHDSVDKLANAVTNLEHVEQELDTIAKAAQTNVDRLVKICSENAILQTKIKKQLEQQVIQNVIEVVVNADSNKDWTLGPTEMEMLVMRLKAMPGIEFDEVNYRKATSFKDSMTLVEIMTILRNLLDDTVAEEDNIFHLTPRALLQ